MISTIVITIPDLAIFAIDFILAVLRNKTVVTRMIGSLNFERMSPHSFVMATKTTWDYRRGDHVVGFDCHGPHYLGESGRPVEKALNPKAKRSLPRTHRSTDPLTSALKLPPVFGQPALPAFPAPDAWLGAGSAESDLDLHSAVPPDWDDDDLAGLY
jgi:hypothetical protein